MPTEQKQGGAESAANIAQAERTGPEPASGPRPILCPYCGQIQPLTDQCARCKGLFEPLSRQATQNAMGPWQIRDEKAPFAPGCSYETLRKMVEKGKVTRSTIVRGPSTRQFWSMACNAPGVAVLLGECHNCHAAVRPDEYICRTCNAVLTASTDRQHLGLGPIKLLPGEAPPHEVASVALGRTADRPEDPNPPRSVPVPPPSQPKSSRSASRSARRRNRRREETLRSTFTAIALFALILVTVIAVSILTARDQATPEANAIQTP